MHLAHYKWLIFLITIYWSELKCQSYNYGFESWQHYDLYEEPNQFLTSNPICFLNFATNNVEKISVDSSYAVRLRNYPFTGNEALLPGFVANFDITSFPFGGTPIQHIPDSIIVYLNLAIMPGDTGLFLVIFKKNSSPISSNAYGLVSVSNGKVRAAVSTQYSTEKPDSVIFLISSGSFDNPLAGSVVDVDGIEFQGSNEQLANNTFNSWSLLSFEEPDEWSTPNFYSTIFQHPPSIERSLDAFSGLYALLLRNVNVSRYGFNQFYGSTFLGEAGTYIPLSLPFTGTEFDFGFHYKYLTAQTDTAWIVLRPSYFDFRVSKRQNIDPITIPLFQSEVYSEVSKRFKLPIKPDSINIEIYAGNYYPGIPDSIGGKPKASSRLYIDDLNLSDDINTDQVSLLDRNPASYNVYYNREGRLIISSNNQVKEKLKIKIYNLNGKLMEQQDLELMESKPIELSTRENYPGVQLIQLENLKASQILKVVR